MPDWGHRAAPLESDQVTPGAIGSAGGIGPRLGRLRQNRLVRQNLVLFAGGLVAGLGGFVYHSVAAHRLGDVVYGEVAALVAIYGVGTAGALVLILVLARYAAALQIQGNAGGIRHIAVRSSLLLLPASAILLLITGLLSKPAVEFLHLHSAVPIYLLALSVIGIWQVAVPRGILQGMQHFQALSINLSLELGARMILLIGLLSAGFQVGGAMLAILLGVGVAYGLGVWSLRGLFAHPPAPVPMRAMVGFSLTAVAGTLGILLLYNLDVILAKHYLDSHGAGLYGGLNKIGTILYFLTLSVSQVLFPRVIEAVARNSHPGRLLLISAGTICFLCAGAIVVFAVVPRLLVLVLFGPTFLDAVPFIAVMGFVGLALALDNLLIQFLMAVHDRLFVPILGLACLTQAVLIVLNHNGPGAIVADVLIATYALLVGLVIRALLLMPKLRPEMLAEGN